MHLGTWCLNFEFNATLPALGKVLEAREMNLTCYGVKEVIDDRPAVLLFHVLSTKARGECLCSSSRSLL
ncbi:hypothetical protein VNO77_03498 [Canavalia gladiata]|uniref:Uncharacterized protein n=1 Tax=Canavalia gladiata TaxID=3824 RepID=A0AAN9MUT0_CANGL